MCFKKVVFTLTPPFLLLKHGKEEIKKISFY